MLCKVLETIEKYDLIKAGDKVVCALSGGADSVALLYVLYMAKEKLGFSLYAANVNHKIRGDEGDGDSLFAKKLCEKLGVELFYKEVDVPNLSKERGISEEECGREERYAFFEEVSQKLSGALIATGHHRNDNAETVLFHLFRGTGLKGLGGIRVKRGNIIRPLLFVERKEIEGFLSENEISWREDSTNKCDKYTRNFIRNVVIKGVETVFPSAVKKISDTAEQLSVDEDFIKKEALKAEAVKDGVLYTKKLLPLHESLKRRIAADFLAELGACEVDRGKILSLLKLCEGQTGKRLDFGNNIILENCYGRVKQVFTEPVKEEWVIPVGSGEGCEIADFRGVWIVKTVDKMEKIGDNRMIVVLDYDKLGEGLVIRHRSPGDYMYPMGMTGKKKLKEIFIDMKIPRAERDRLTLLAKGDEVLFVPFVRKSGSYVSDENTKRFLVAEYKIRKEGEKQNGKQV